MRGEIKSLTGLRGVATCYVVAFHLYGNAMSDTTVFGRALLHGYLAVDLFFVLSGFVMALSYARLFERPSVRSYLVFLARRAARVYPLYVVLLCVVGAGLVFGVGGHGDPSPLGEVFALNLLLVQAWGLGYSVIVPSWSISTELAAYLLFPALLVVALRTGPVTAALVLGGAIAALVALGTLPTPVDFAGLRIGPLNVSWDYSPWPLVRCLLEFTIGLLAFRAATQVSRPAIVSTLAVAGIVALLAVPGADVVLVVLFAVLIASLSPSAGPAARVLACRPVHLLGELSYAIYLLHFQLVRFERLLPPRLAPHVGEAGARVVTQAIVLGTLLVAAVFCRRFIELPGLAIVRRWARRLESPVPA